MLAAIIESSDDAIISKTLDGVITSWNHSAQMMFGYSAEEAIGKNITLIIPPDRLQEENLIISKVRSGEKIDHFETIRHTKYGSEIYISLTVSPIKDSKGRIIGASKIARDISRQKQDEESLRRLYNEVKSLNTKKDEFIGLASHELKTPVTSISGYLQILERNLPDDNKRNKLFVKKAIQQVDRLSALVADLLDVSKIQAGHLPLSFSSFDLLKVIEGVAEIGKHLYSSHTLEVNYPSDSLWIYADKQRIEQVLINLISNAVKYSPEANRVIINIVRSNDKIKIGIQDFGIGIPETEQKHIFSKFYRGGGLSSQISGLGIGLYLSSEIIKQHNGKIWVDSKPDHGSTFFFEIPVSLEKIPSQNRFNSGS
jgi:PAS domain S-box-containing protein